MFERLQETDAQLASYLQDELYRQRNTLELIASENFVPLEVLEAQGSILTNKYAEGYPGRRYHAGCEVIDEIETLAINRAKELFHAEYANVQPHSGVNANLAVYVAMLKPGDRILGLALDRGGHLSHGSPVNISGQYYTCKSYGLDAKTERIDYNGLYELACRFKPKLIVTGASAYPRDIDYSRFREIADEVQAYLMVDMAHVAGLVAAGLLNNPVFDADLVTSTTTKTLCGARGGLILGKEEYASLIDGAIFPGIQGGPSPQIMAAKAYTFKRAMSAEFKEYALNMVKNAKYLAQFFLEKGFQLITGGTETHLLLINVKPLGLLGSEAEALLSQVGIMVNKNLIPFDTESPVKTSGIRIGTAAITSRGAKEEHMERIGEMIFQTLQSKGEYQETVAHEVQEICHSLPLYPEFETK